MVPDKKELSGPRSKQGVILYDEWYDLATSGLTNAEKFADVSAFLLKAPNPKVKRDSEFERLPDENDPYWEE